MPVRRGTHDSLLRALRFPGARLVRGDAGCYTSICFRLVIVVRLRPAIIARSATHPEACGRWRRYSACRVERRSTVGRHTPEIRAVSAARSRLALTDGEGW